MMSKWPLGIRDVPLRLERDRSARAVAVSQEAFIDSILARFNIIDATTVTTPLTPGFHLTAARVVRSQYVPRLRFR